METPRNTTAIASGMVAVQADCSPDEALLLMQARADASHRTLDEVAHAVVDRSIRFDE